MKTGWLIRYMAFAAISVAMGLHILSNATPTPQQREALLAPIPPSPATGWFKANLVRREITRRASTYALQYFTTVLEEIEKAEAAK